MWVMLKNFPPELSLAGVFYRDRDEWLRHLMKHPDIELSAHKLVGCYLGMNINRTTRDVWKMEKTIAEDLCVSRSTVARAVRVLRDLKLIEVKQEGRRGLKKAVNRYSMLFPWHST